MIRRKSYSPISTKNLLLFLLPFIVLTYLISLAAKPVKGISLKESVLEFPEITPLADPNPSQTKVISYNIGYASGDKNNKGSILTEKEITQNLDTIAQTIKTQNPDIVGLQEVDFKAKRSFDINQLEYIAQNAGLPYAAFVITWNKRYMPWPYWPPSIHFGQVVSGQAVLSRYPIASQSLLTFDKPSENPFWYNWFYLDRIAQNLTIKLPNGAVNVWHIHLEAFKSKARLSQAIALSQAILKKITDKTILLGDFNSVSKVKEGLSAKQQAVLEDNGEALEVILRHTKLINAETPDTGLTMPSWEPIKKIDHILYSSDWNLADVYVVDGITASDHLAVVAVLNSD
jgi:endonuclease/exonuclease/phosphatase family metal-dependent hydrolase